MKIALSAIGLFFLTVWSVNAQVVWLNPKPIGADLNDVVFADSLHGVIIGKYGTILYTEDAGEQWEIVLTGAESGFNNLQYIDGRYYTSNGSLFSSSNGRTWEMIYFDQLYSVNTFRFVDHLHGYGLFNSNTGAKFGETIDGGYTWRLSDWMQSPPGVNSRMRFTSAGIGYFSDGKAVYKTVDSCQTWNLIRDFSAGNRGIIITALSDNKLIVGIRSILPETYGYVVLTNDGGVTFDTVYQGDQYPTAIDFFDGRHGLIALNKVYSYADTTVRELVLQTEDGGKTWAYNYMPNLGNFNGLNYVKKGEAYIVGDLGRICKSTDDGKSWSLYWPVNYDIYLYMIYLGNKKLIRYNVNNFGFKLEKTYDEGKTWKELPCPHSDFFPKFSDSLYGCEAYRYAAGDSVGTNYTLDGGLSWHTNRAKFKLKAVTDFNVVSPGIIFLTQPDNSFVYSENNGQSWIRQPIPFTNGILQPLSVDSLLYIYKDVIFDSILRCQIFTWLSVDRGISWKLMGAVDMIGLYRIKMIRTNSKGDIFLMLHADIWKDMFNDKLYFSHDYGSTWVVTDSIQDVTGFEAIDLNDKGVGRVMSFDYLKLEDLRIHTTTDWGHTWKDEEFVLPSIFCSMVIAEDGSTILGGQFGFLIKVYGPDGPYGFIDMKTQNDVIVFPNPTSDIVTFRLDSPAPASVDFTLSDLQGRIVMRFTDLLKKGDKEARINMATLSSGIYFYRLEFNNTAKTGKLLIGR